MKTTLFDEMDYVKVGETDAACLTAAAQGGDIELLLAAIKNIANTRNMTQLAADAGLGRASLYKALTPGAKPQFETIMKLVCALGFKLEFRSVRN